MKNFSEQWKALEDKKGGDKPEVPKITKALPIVKEQKLSGTTYTKQLAFIPSPWLVLSTLRHPSSRDPPFYSTQID
jgi:hypothetical protein